MDLKTIQRERLRQYLECEEKILLGQEYVIGSRTFRRADLETVRKVIANLIDSGVTLEDNDNSLNRGRQKRVVFVD